MAIHPDFLAMNRIMVALSKLSKDDREYVLKKANECDFEAKEESDTPIADSMENQLPE